MPLVAAALFATLFGATTAIGMPFAFGAAGETSDASHLDHIDALVLLVDAPPACAQQAALVSEVRAALGTTPRAAAVQVQIRAHDVGWRATVTTASDVRTLLTTESDCHALDAALVVVLTLLLTPDARGAQDLPPIEGDGRTSSNGGPTVASSPPAVSRKASGDGERTGPLAFDAAVALGTGVTLTPAPGLRLAAALRTSPWHSSTSGLDAELGVTGWWPQALETKLRGATIATTSVALEVDAFLCPRAVALTRFEVAGCLGARVPYLLRDTAAIDGDATVLDDADFVDGDGGRLTTAAALELRSRVWLTDAVALSVAAGLAAELTPGPNVTIDSRSFLERTLWPSARVGVTWLP